MCEVPQEESFLRGSQECKRSAFHNTEQEPDQEEENHIDMVNINSINFNSKHSVIIANLKTSLNKVVIKYHIK